MHTKYVRGLSRIIIDWDPGEAARCCGEALSDLSSPITTKTSFIIFTLVVKNAVSAPKKRAPRSRKGLKTGIISL